MFIAAENKLPMKVKNYTKTLTIQNSLTVCSFFSQVNKRWSLINQFWFDST